MGAAVGASVVFAGGGTAQTKPRTSGPVGSTPGVSAAPATSGKDGPVTVDADSLESMQKEGLSVFKGSVVARQNNSVQYADRMEVYTDAKTDRIERVVSIGNVRIITRDCRMGTALRAEYYDGEQRVVLIGNARVWRVPRRGPKPRRGRQAGARQGYLLPGPPQNRDQDGSDRTHMPLIWKV